MKKPKKTTCLSPVPNNPRDNELYVDKNEKKREDKFNKEHMLFDATNQKFLNTIRKSRAEDRYGYRTGAGHWKDRDEPDAAHQERQADVINAMMQRRKAAVGRDRLKAQNRVPTRGVTGKKLFEQFINEAYKITKHEIDCSDFVNIYNAAQHLSCEKWIWFVQDICGS